MVSYFIPMIVCTKSWLQLITWHFFQIILLCFLFFIFLPSVFLRLPYCTMYMLYFTISLLCFPNSASQICIPFPAYLRFFPVSASLLWFPFPLPFSEFLSLLPLYAFLSCFPSLISFPTWPLPFSEFLSLLPLYAFLSCFPSLLSFPASLLWVPFSASFSSFTICNIYPLLSPPLPLVSQNIVGKTSGETFIFATWPA